MTPLPSPLSNDELRLRARRIKLVLTDSDGVLTDAGVYYSERGEELKRFSIRDGMGVELLRNGGIATAIVTGEKSGSVARRAEKLGIKAYLGIKDKAALLPICMAEAGATAGEVAYIGDDVNDKPIMNLVHEEGLTAIPADALPALRGSAHFQAEQPGGHGAFRAFADWILSLREELH